MKEFSRKEIAYERTLFFSDAIVAIAITLLALELKIQAPAGKTLTFADLLAPWHKYLAFILSFVSIAGFWRRHHDFFIYIKKLDERMLFVNICWLLFVVVLPFTTSLLSDHFGDVPAVTLYSLNIFLLAVAQNSLWDYADAKDGYIDKEQLGDEKSKEIRRMLNLDMLNGLIALIVAFFMPKLAFFLLFFKLPLFIFVAFIIARKRRNEVREMRGGK
jgi:uncharacterized membrane protein